MKEFYIIIYVGVFVLLNFPNLIGQECKDYKYLVAILKMETSTEINNEIKRIFKKDLKRKSRKKSKIEFNVSNRINYLPLYKTFNRKLDSIFFSHYYLSYKDEKLEEKHDRQERFKPYKSKCLTRLIPLKDTFLELRFSKSRESYLIAELLDKRINQGQIKYGKAIQFLFLFDDSGVITKVYNTARMYN